MKLSKRLQRVVANVQSNGVVADIGCDHGFTSIYLVQSHKAAGAIALDINQGPLARAKEHILQYGLEDKIALRLSDGAKELLPGEADTLLISGMGGALIRRILLESREVTETAKELVLSPQSEIFLVRKCLHELGFQIAAEEMVLDQGKYYVIIRAIPGQETYQEEIEYLYGKKLIDSRDEIFSSFIGREQMRVDRVLQTLELQKLSLAGELRKKKLLKEKTQLYEVMNRLKST